MCQKGGYNLEVKSDALRLLTSSETQFFDPEWKVMSTLRRCLKLKIQKKKLESPF